jgi:hypothetical protein
VDVTLTSGAVQRGAISSGRLRMRSRA